MAVLSSCNWGSELSVPSKIAGEALLLYLLPLITTKEVRELMNHGSDAPCLNVFLFQV